ncbi:MAG: M20/M25/M40 family metallo-hydrolase [Bacteroidetes bacterium]|nr:M20/M25/M40 family metallo-hydrolase [Bacteroidota bacterium]MBU2585102.1 M20/M25/M40 family metallo-hydrolase [Bacteroidota bacterium]
MKKTDYLFFKLFTPVALIFALIVSVHSQTLNQQYLDIAEKIVKTALIDQKGYKLLEELCEIGPRLSGSDESLQAILWAKKKMEDLGFDKVWLQPVMVPRWVRGNVGSAKIVESKKFNGKKLNIAAFGGSVGTKKEGIITEVVTVNNFEELKKVRSKIKNKIVFFNRSLDLRELNTFAGYGGAVDQRTQGAIEAARFGAVGIIVRSVTTKHDNVPHVGVMSYVDSLPKIPSVAIGYRDADFLSEAVKQDSSLKINLKLSCKTLPDVQSYNVIGELKGTERPDEIIVVGGHFDSWDKGCGAHDDGAGCIQSMEVLDLFKRLDIKPKRTIRCVFFINEENGVRGAIEYGNYADTAKEIHYAAIESD